MNAIDYSGYPDCRPEYIEAYERMGISPRATVSRKGRDPPAPLQELGKSAIVTRALELGVPLAVTHSAMTRHGTAPMRTLRCLHPSCAGVREAGEGPGPAPRMTGGRPTGASGQMSRFLTRARASRCTCVAARRSRP